MLATARLDREPAGEVDAERAEGHEHKNRQDREPARDQRDHPDIQEHKRQVGEKRARLTVVVAHGLDRLEALGMLARRHSAKGVDVGGEQAIERGAAFPMVVARTLGRHDARAKNAQRELKTQRGQHA
ncbi:MAG: hypothetical protein HC794_06695 [Nitrospiraceae bacterium]|nr:hypothetical protein [Nitrospiraceae bacterium]